MREVRKAEAGDPIPIVAEALTRDVRCLAFDEMVVNNSADAMILSRLFTALIERGVTVVATSNRPPQDLYKDGLNREHFLRSEEHTSELQSLMRISYAVFCLNKKKKHTQPTTKNKP